MRIAAMTMAATLGLVLTAAPARGQDEAQHLAHCNNEQDQFSSQLVVAGCTAVIDSGRLTGKNLGLAHYLRGRAHQAQASFALAIRDYDRALQLDPDLREALWARGHARRGAGEHAHAAADFSQILRLDPSAGRAHYWRGLSLDRLGRDEEALADFDAALAMEPNSQAAGHAWLRNSACWSRARLGRELDRARTDCDEAVRLERDASYLDSRALVALKQGRHQDAWNDYDEAVRLRPDYAHYLYGRGIAALRLGRTTEGQADIARAVSLEPRIVDTFAEYGVRP